MKELSSTKVTVRLRKTEGSRDRELIKSIREDVVEYEYKS
jgi:hypothetical protein